MKVISRKNNNTSILGTTTAALLVFLVSLLSQAQRHSVHGILITLKEEQCLEKTGLLFQDSDEDLLIARQEFSEAMSIETTSIDKMLATFPDDKLRNYEANCSKYRGKMHTIKIDFFDCTLRGAQGDIELTIKNFANCMADDEDCVGFGQEHLLQESWEEMGLDCILEEEETKKNPSKKDNNVDDDITKKEKEAAAAGADDVDKEEKKSEYVPKEDQDGTGKKKKSGGFMKFVLFMSLCGMGFFAFDRKRRGLPIELPEGISSRIPFGRGASVSRFDRRPQTGFVSDYNLLSATEDNSLQLSSNLA
jgi:hypothetical protein